MHELGITRTIVNIVEEAAQGRRVVAVVLHVGKLAGVMPDAIAFCFDVVCKGTKVEGAALTIVEPDDAELKVKTIEVEEPSCV